MKKYLLLFVASLASGSAFASTYYASPNGSGNGNSYSSPCSFSNGLKKLNNGGDTLYLLGGQYDLGNTAIQNLNGTAQRRIVISGYPGELAILDFRTTPYGTRGLQVKSTTTYLHIKDLTLRYSGKNNLYNEGSYNYFENLDIYGSADTGCQMKNGGNNIIKNVDSHDNFDYQTMSGSTANFGGNADGFADKQGDACPGNVYIGCRSWNNSDDGWDSFQRVTNGTPTVYINCITYNNGPATYDLSEHPRVLGKDAGLSCFTDKDLKNFANGGNPNGFKLGGQGTNHNTELYRCLAVGHRSKGFDQNNNAGNMKVINCTAYDNNINYGFGNDYAYTLTVYNNVSLSPRSSHWKRSDKGTTTQEHNTWNTGYSASESDFEGLDIESIINAPRNADGSLAETTQFHLKSTATNLIDKGATFTDFSGDKISDYVSFKGTAPDLGCYEYDTSSGIQGVIINGSDLNPNMPRYNVKGQQVDSNYKGLVIQGGKKYIQK